MLRFQASSLSRCFKPHITQENAYNLIHLKKYVFEIFGEIFHFSKIREYTNIFQTASLGMTHRNVGFLFKIVKNLDLGVPGQYLRPMVQWNVLYIIPIWYLRCEFYWWVHKERKKLLLIALWYLPINNLRISILEFTFSTRNWLKFCQKAAI